MRLFVAVTMPASVTAVIDTAIAPWRERFPEARWVPPHHRHVTLTFLGTTPRNLQGWVRERIREVATSWGPFDIRLAGLGGFPSIEQARIAWIGVDDPDQQLGGLSLALGEALSPGFASDQRPFTPHVTVARSDRDLALTGPSEPEPPPAGAISVREIVLYRSHADRPASRYEALATFTLVD